MKKKIYIFVLLAILTNAAFAAEYEEDFDFPQATLSKVCTLKLLNSTDTSLVFKDISAGKGPFASLVTFNCEKMNLGGEIKNIEIGEEIDTGQEIHFSASFAFPQRVDIPKETNEEERLFWLGQLRKEFQDNMASKKASFPYAILKSRNKTNKKACTIVFYPYQGVAEVVVYKNLLVSFKDKTTADPCITNMELNEKIGKHSYFRSLKDFEDCYRK